MGNGKTEEARLFLNSLICTLPESVLWQEFRKKINTYIKTRDISGFGEWDAIRQTMRAGTIANGVAADHYNYLKSRSDWGRWNSVFQSCKKDAPQFASSMLLLAHFEDLVNQKIQNIDFIFEFGGGFGVLCTAIHRLGFSGKYVIFDFPELLAIQKYYLEQNGILTSGEAGVVFKCSVDELQNISQGSKNSLCVSAHALEEAPEKLVKQIFSAVRQFDNFLFAIGVKGKGKVSNAFALFNTFMESMQKEFSGFSFGYVPLLSQETHYIFYGTKTGASKLK